MKITAADRVGIPSPDRHERWTEWRGGGADDDRGVSRPCRSRPVCAFFFGFAVIDPGIIFPPPHTDRRRVCDGLACGRGTTGRRWEVCAVTRVVGRRWRDGRVGGRTRQSEIGERVEVCGGIETRECGGRDEKKKERKKNANRN